MIQLRSKNDYEQNLDILISTYNLWGTFCHIIERERELNLRERESFIITRDTRCALGKHARLIEKAWKVALNAERRVKPVRAKGLGRNSFP